MHCIKPMPGTYTILKQASKNLKLRDYGFIVSYEAISIVDRIAKFPNRRGGTKRGDMTKEGAITQEVKHIISLSSKVLLSIKDILNRGDTVDYL